MRSEIINGLLGFDLLFPNWNKKPLYFLCVYDPLQCLLQDDIQATNMPGKAYDYDSSIPTTRLERLLRERELRKSHRSNSQSTDNLRDASKEVDANGKKNNLIFSDVDKLSLEEEVLGGLLAARNMSDGSKKPDGRPSKQRLLVVANRLPVAATRKDEDSWTLEISAGGLVSALLGKFYKILL